MQYKIGMLALVCATVMSFTITSKPDFRPPGTVEIVDNFFYDATEISNLNWKEYLSYIEHRDGKDAERYQQAFPDTTVWRDGEFFNEPYVRNYFWHSAFGDYPVVGVSHQQAKDFCAWRTGAVITMLEANNIDAPKSFEYRLPTMTEWELMANAGMSDKSKKYYSKRVEKQKKTENSYARVPLANLKYRPDEKTTEGDLEILRSGNTFINPAPTRSYLPNKYGVYNIYGNVAEMIDDEGLAVGGSFEHYYDDIVPQNTVLNYDGPKSWLGFRCVCEIIEK